MTRIVLFAIVFFSCQVVASAEASAQSAEATVQGTVRDTSGAVIPAVTITLRPTGAGPDRSAATGTDGTYLFRVPPGEYVVDAVLSGFGRETATLQAAAGSTHTVDLTLEIAPLTETVTVTRAESDHAVIPHPIAIVQGDDIQTFRRGVSPAEAFAGIPGMFVSNRRNFSLSGGLQLAMRSPLPRFGLRGVHVVQDGIPLTMADGTTEPTNLDPGSMGRVEILRGPSSVLYGNAAGGVLSVQTAFPAAGTFVVEPDLQFGSHGYRRFQVKLHGSEGRVSYLLNASQMETDGFRTHSAADVRRVNLVTRVALAPTTELRGVFNVYDLPFGESAATLTLEDARDNPTTVRPQALTQGWGESTTQGQGGVTLEHQFGNGHRIRGTGWALWRDVFNPIPFAVVQLDRRAGGFRSEYEGAAVAGGLPLTWTAGIDISNQGDDRLESENAGVPSLGARTLPGAPVIDQREEVLSVGPFVQVRAALADRWMLTGGLRYDAYDFSANDHLLADGDQSGGRTLDAFSPMVGLTFAATSDLNIYGSFATAYQTPTTVELSNTPTGAGGFNEALEPETLRTVEVGARGAVDRLGLRFAVGTYFSRLDDALAQFTRPDEATFFRNAGRASRNGVEAMVEWTPLPRLTTRLAYTYQDFEFIEFVAPEGDFSGKAEPGVPPHQLFLSAAYETPSGLFSAIDLRSVDAYPVNSTNTIENWAYQVVNLRFGLRQRWSGVRLRPFVGIDNLFNERYNGSAITNSVGDRFFEPAPGREIYVGIAFGGPVF